MNIRPNRVKQRLAAGQVATILAGTNDPDLIDQLGPLGADGIWLEGEHGGVDYADLGNLTRACDLWGVTSVVRVMANDQSMLMVLIEDIAAVHRLDEIIKVDHIDVFFVAPSDLATSMGHIGNTAHPEVQKTIDAALTKIVQAGRV